MDRPERRRILRDSAAVGAATGAYGLSFGALGTAAGLSVAQTCVLSLAAFTGASQFAFVGSVASPWSATVSALLLGMRNALYSVRMRPVLGASGWRRVAAAQLTIDESTAMATGHADDGGARLAFWATGASVYLLWNLATLAGAVGAAHLASPRRLGLDAAEPAAFLALLAPRLTDRRVRVAAVAAAALALVAAPLTPVGVPVLLAGVMAVAGAGGAVRDGHPTTPEAAP